MSADDDAATGLPVGPQARVQELGAAGVNESGGAVLEQLGDAQQGGQVLLLGGHLALQTEDVGKVV